MTEGVALVELAQVWRGPAMESVHHGVIAVARPDGTLLEARGDTEWAPTPRSSLKPFQAMALVESGAADALNLTQEHIALACASHSAQPFQVELAREWLGRLGLSEQALVCGPALPRAIEDQAAAFASGGPRRIYNNCSGKHCGFLTMARHMGAGLDYAAWDHPAQRLYRDILAEFAGLDPAALLHGGDGCGLPAIALPVGAMARAMARFGAGEARSAARRDAARRVREAMIAHPDHLAAKDSATSRLIRACGGRLALKGGAEGYVVACVTEPALGVAIKVADGDPAGRAKMGVLAALLGKLGVLPAEAVARLVVAVEPPTVDSNGARVGRVEVVIGGAG